MSFIRRKKKEKENKCFISEDGGYKCKGFQTECKYYVKNKFDNHCAYCWVLLQSEVYIRCNNKEANGEAKLMLE